jgi:hypothetical protein
MSERPELFKKLEPVAVAEVKAIVGDDSQAERLDGPKSDKGKRKRRKRTGSRTTPRKAKPKKVKGTKFRPSDQQWLEAIACFKPLWDLALQLEAIIETPARGRRRGRNREYTPFEAIFFEVAAFRFKSYELVADNLKDLDLWNRLRAAVEAAYPDDSRMRLSPSPITRAQNYRFRMKYLSDYLIEVIHNVVDEAAVTVAQYMGMLVPGLGSLTNPDLRSFVAADGTWIPALTKLTHDDAVDLETGEVIRRFDLHAIPYHTADGEYASSPGYLLSMVLARNGYKKERVILSTRLKSAKNPEMPRNDATIVVNTILDLIERFPYLRAGLKGLVYDMALSVADFDRLLDAGLIPVSRVPLTKNGRVSIENLGLHTFTLNGVSVTRIVYAVHGTPCIVITDGVGIDYYQPLRMTQIKHDKRKKRPETVTIWTVPDNPLVPANLVGCTTRVRHTRTFTELNAGKSRSRSLRLIPESDDRFGDIIGLRQDTESANSDLKTNLGTRRCRTLRHNNVEFNKIGYQIHVLITALSAYFNRTGADMTAWFGQHQLASKKRHLELGDC